MAVAEILAGAGSLIGSGAAYFGAAKAGRDAARATAEANVANQRMMDENHMFQERMSATALQRFKGDAIRAGFNPTLLLTGGTGPGATPMGGMIPAQSSAEARVSTGLERARVSAAASERALAAGMRMREAELMEANTRKVMSEAATADSLTRLNDQKLISDKIATELLKGDLSDQKSRLNWVDSWKSLDDRGEQGTPALLRGFLREFFHVMRGR